MLTTILNAQKIGKKRVAVPYSQFKESVLKLLQAKGIVASVRVQESPKAKLVITLVSDPKKNRLHGIRRVSKPGRRVMSKRTEVPFSLDGAGFFVLSTSKGIMDDTQARKENVGGEIICEIW